MKKDIVIKNKKLYKQLAKVGYNDVILHKDNGFFYVETSRNTFEFSITADNFNEMPVDMWVYIITNQLSK